ncbi:hypothetical protein GCM10010359_55830 [Streptomyces morookaense]|nr:hypothetical protein GCM10010359_55830 [Streptomyces morookaense]
MSARALSFGAIAEAYERFRPGYPEELFDLVMTYAGRPVRTALEIGAGTGKATRLFAEHGVTVTATEPDAAMLAELNKTVSENVTTVRVAFEDLRPGETYGLVYAAAALHWTRPEDRWSRVAALLEPEGVFASFGGPVQVADPTVEDSVRAARAPFLETDEVPSPDGTAPDGDSRRTTRSRGSCPRQSRSPPTSLFISRVGDPSRGDGPPWGPRRAPPDGLRRDGHVRRLLMPGTHRDHPILRLPLERHRSRPEQQQPLTVEGRDVTAHRTTS